MSLEIIYTDTLRMYTSQIVLQDQIELNQSHLLKFGICPNLTRVFIQTMWLTRCKILNFLSYRIHSNNVVNDQILIRIPCFNQTVSD